MQNKLTDRAFDVKIHDLGQRVKQLEHAVKELKALIAITEAGKEKGR